MGVLGHPQCTQRVTEGAVGMWSRTGLGWHRPQALTRAWAEFLLFG